MNRRSSRNRHGTIAGVIAVVALMLLAACGNAATESGSSTEEAAPLRLGFSAWPGWFPWQVAEEKGLFAAAGLDVDLKYFESYTDSLNALKAGQLDANSQTLGDTISSLSSGAEQVVTLVNDNSTGNDQIIVAPGINSVADLKGKTVGVEEGTVDHFLLLLGLEKAGLKQSDIVFKNLLTDAAVAAFAAGQLDAVGAFAPFTTTALEREGSKALFTSADYPGAIPDHVVFDKKFVEARPDDVQKLTDVWFDTLAYIAANRDESVAIMAKKGDVSQQEYADYEKGTRIFSAEDNLAAFAPGETMANLNFAAITIAKFLKDGGLVDETPDITGLLDGRFVQRWVDTEGSERASEGTVETETTENTGAPAE